MTDVKAMLAKFKGNTVPAQKDLSSAQAAYNTAAKALPDMKVGSIVYPGYPFGSPYHYLIWTKGSEPFSSRLFSPVLVDATSGDLVSVVRMPVYLRALEVSRPLHFGDYGGVPLKVIWVIFDLIAIVVLISGLYLWWVRRKRHESYFLTVSEGVEASLE